jgi:elongation factor Ts
MPFSAQDVKNLREKTGCGMMDCKKALACTGGDILVAADYLRERGFAAAVKKSGRAVSEGLVFSMVKNNKGVIIEVNSETDFVSGNENFQDFVKTCAETVLESNPASVDELLAVKINSGKTVKELLNEKILTMGENIKIRRFAMFEGLVSSYVHAGGKIAVLVKFSGDNSLINNSDFLSISKDIAMQIAASNPSYLNIESVPNEVIEHEKKILCEQIINDGKPPEIANKIVSGRIGKFYKEVCLLEQPFVKDLSISVRKYIENFSKSVKIDKFERFERGEILENC